MANSTADGSVVIDVNMDVSQAEKRLGKLRDNIKKTEKEIADATTARDEAQKKLDNSPLEQEQKKLQDMMAARKKAAEVESSLVPISKEISDLEAKLSEQQQNRLRTEENIKKTKDAIISAEKELSILESSPKNNERYKKRVEELNEFLRVARPAVGNMGTNLDLYNREIQNAVASLDQLKERADKISLGNPETVASNEEVKSQEEKIKTIQDEWKATQKDVERYTAQIEKANEKLGEQKTEAGILTQEIDRASKSQGLFEKSADESGKAMTRFNRRIVELVKSAFIFNVISAGLRSIQQITMKYIKTNDEARQAIAQLKGALLTLAQPLIEVIIPAFTTFVNVLSRIVVALASLVSTLFGKTLKSSSAGAKSLNDEAKALSGVGAAADEAAGSLAGFDEINTIQTENAGGGGASAEIAPDFSWMDETDGLVDRLKEIADLVGLIAAGLLLWKIGTMLPGVLGQIATKLGGILLIIGGLLLFWHGLTDAWENGVDWMNLIEMIGGLAAAAAGLYITLRPVAAGIALVVGGIAMLITAFRDAMKNGWNLQNTLLAIAGILGTGLGISLLVGSFVPLLIAAIAAVLLALTIATGHGEELLDGIRTAIEGFVDFFTGIFTGDIEKAVGGVSKIFGGLKTAVFAVIDGIKDTLLSFLTWLDEKTGGKFHAIIEVAKGFVDGFYTGVKITVGNILDGIKQFFTGIIQLVTGVFTNDWELAWEGVKNIFFGRLQEMSNVLTGWIGSIISGISGMVTKIKGIIKGILSGINTSVSSFGDNGGRSSSLSRARIPSIPEAKIPRLAQGAVIPPNREFMAVLGDQRHGTNLEAPEDLIRKIVREESGGGNAELVQLLQSILSAVKEGHIIMVDGSVFGRTAIKTINSVNTSAGKQLLLI